MALSETVTDTGTVAAGELPSGACQTTPKPSTKACEAGRSVVKPAELVTGRTFTVVPVGSAPWGTTTLASRPLADKLTVSGEPAVTVPETGVPKSPAGIDAGRESDVEVDVVVVTEPGAVEVVVVPVAVPPDVVDVVVPATVVVVELVVVDVVVVDVVVELVVVELEVVVVAQLPKVTGAVPTTAMAAWAVACRLGVSGSSPGGSSAWPAGPVM
jgi:hypothetical protein